MKVAVGTLLAGVVGAVIGLFVATYSGWTDWWLWSVMAGVLIGGVPGLFLGWIMGMQGGGLSGSDQAVPTAPAWGVCTGFVYGIGLGPAFMATMGFCVGQFFDLCGWGSLGPSLLVEGTLLGLYVGPVLCIMAFEASYFVGMGDFLSFGAEEN